MSAGPGGGGYTDRREDYIMRAFGGYVGGSPEEFIIVAFDGSGGELGVGVGVFGLKVESVDVLEGETVDMGQVHRVWSIGSRLPEWYGDGRTGNQDGEDVGGAAGVLKCLSIGGVLLIGDNLQTVTDIVWLAQEREMSAREAMRHRCVPALQMMR